MSGRGTAGSLGVATGQMPGAGIGVVAAVGEPCAWEGAVALGEPAAR
jgi:hypothetical protein